MTPDARFQLVGREDEDRELEAIERRLRVLGIRPDQLKIERWDEKQVLVTGSFLRRLDPQYGPKLGQEFVYTTAGVSMAFDEFRLSLNRLVPEWRQDD